MEVLFEGNVRPFENLGVATHEVVKDTRGWAVVLLGLHFEIRDYRIETIAQTNGTRFPQEAFIQPAWAQIVFNDDATVGVYLFPPKGETAELPLLSYLYSWHNYKPEYIEDSPLWSIDDTDEDKALHRLLITNDQHRVITKISFKRTWAIDKYDSHVTLG